MTQNKQSIWQRIRRLFRANAHDALDQLEARDTPKLLDQSIRDYEAVLTGSRASVAALVGNLTLMKKRHSEAVSSISAWGVRAELANERAQIARANGNLQEAEKNERLAQRAFEEQIEAERTAATLAADIQRETDNVAQLKTGLSNTEKNLNQARRRRDSLKSELATANTKIELQKAADAVSNSDPTNAINRAARVVEERSALAEGLVHMAASTLENEFASIENEFVSIEANKRLKALQSGVGNQKQVAK